MSLRIIVLAKQVPDTRNVGPDAMTPEGTVNRAALPAVFNPEDLNALEQALRLKEQFPGSTISVVTMGLPKSAEVIRESLYRGADAGYVVTDRCLGGADTLATSYTISQAIKKIGDYDIILGGRQAIDGDTAQVGPQIAEKLGLTQVTYAEEILSLDEAARKIVIKRHIDVTLDDNLASCLIEREDLLSVSNLSETELLSDLWTYLSCITVDSLTTTEDDVIVTDLLNGLADCVTCGKCVCTAKTAIGYDVTSICTTVE